VRVFGDGSSAEIGFRRIIRKTKRRVRSLNRRIRRLQRRGIKPDKVFQLQTQVAGQQLVLNDLITCRDSDATGGGGGGNGGGGGTTPPTDSACSVVGGTSGLTARIINGSACTVGNSPVVEVLVLDSFGSPLGSCSGTALTARAVLTAAHCFLDNPGGAQIITGVGTFTASSFHVHPGYSSGFRATDEENDIAIVLLGQDLPTRTVALLGSNDLTAGETGIIAGYGLDENGGAGTLRAGNITLNQATAHSVVALFNGSGSNTCSGDSGGPFLVKRGSTWVIAGVTSNGLLVNCGAGDESRFANTTHPDNLSFIRSLVPGA